MHGHVREQGGNSLEVRLVVPEVGHHHNGIGRYVSELQHGLGQRGVDTEQVAFRYMPGASRRSVLKAVPIGVMAAPGTAIMHFTQIQGASMLLFRKYPRTVVTVHDLGALLCPEDRAVRNGLDRFLLRLSLTGMRRADHIITVSEFTKQCLVNVLQYDPGRIDAIPHGADNQRFKPVPHARSLLQQRYCPDLAPDKRIVLYVGSEQPRKSLSTLVHALVALKRRGQHIHWLKIGPPLCQPEHQRLVHIIEEYGLQNDVTFVETVPDEDLPLFYSAADVYVQPSVWEGFGFPIVEAMACGTPVVTTSAAALKEVAGDAALLVEPRDSAALAAAMHSVLRDDVLAHALAYQGLKRAETFSWRTTVERTMLTYTSVLDQYATQKTMVNV
jgi:glycosyltransferase involved in cell wall biosynthesis